MILLYSISKTKKVNLSISQGDIIENFEIKPILLFIPVRIFLLIEIVMIEIPD